MITDYIQNAILYSLGSRGGAPKRMQITTTPSKMPQTTRSCSPRHESSSSPLSHEKKLSNKSTTTKHSSNCTSVQRSSPDGLPIRDRTYSDASSRSRSSSTTTSMQQQIRQHEERLAKNRKIVNGYLKKISALAGKQDNNNNNNKLLNLKIDKNTGMCYFPYRRFIIVLEVPGDRPGHLYVYTCVCRLEKGDSRVKVMEKSMQLNFMQNGTRGSTLGVDGDEVNLCFSIPIAGLQQAAAAGGDSLRVVLEDFMQTALEANEQLVRVKRR